MKLIEAQVQKATESPILAGSERPKAHARSLDMACITTDRLLLRHPSLADLAALHRIYSNPAVMRFSGSVPHKDMADTLEWFGNRLELTADVAEDFVIEFEGCVVGKAGFVAYPEIGIALDPAVWGHGIATEAITAIVDRAFNFLHLPFVTAEIARENVASTRVFTKLGFGRIGRPKQSDRPPKPIPQFDLYGLERLQWRVSARAKS